MIKTSQYSGHNVIHIGIVAGARTISENGQGFTGLKQRCELTDGEVGPLARAVDGEETQTDYLESKQMGVGVG